MKKILYFTILAGLITACLTSCLDKGDETFALQEGKADQLLAGAWMVESCELYDRETNAYVSQFLNDPALGTAYVLAGEEDSRYYAAGASSRPLSWHINNDNDVITLDDNNYRVVSLGRQLLVISKAGSVNGENYMKRYRLVKVGDTGYNPTGGYGELNGNAVYTVTTGEAGHFTHNGYSVTVPMGAVPNGDNGQAGRVAFSAESLDNNSLPSQAPAGAVQGSAVNFSPSNFTFESPLVIDVPLGGYSPDKVSLYHWDSMLGKWTVVPFSTINADGTASVSTIDLGYFILVVNPSTSVMGGVRIKNVYTESGYYYYVTLKSLNDGAGTSIAFASGSSDLYMANVPKGNYSAIVTRQWRSSLDQGVTRIESVTYTFDLTVSSTLVASGSSYGTYSGWTDINLKNINWTSGRPSAWGDVTVTYGTGTFQATLNWVNYQNSTVDYDLHLTTPSGKEVYYRNKSDGNFKLDRDMTHSAGNCVENIYSIANPLPAGTYTVRVHHYGGATGHTYTCRVIVNGYMVKSYSGITNSGYQQIYTFTLQ